MKNKFIVVSMALSMFLLVPLCFVACESEQDPVDNPQSTVAEQSAVESTIPESTDFESAASETDVTETIDSVTTESVTTDSETEASETDLEGEISTPEYTVSVINGAYYLNFTQGNGEEEESGSQSGNNMIVGDKSFIAFSSVAQMKQAFRENLLTEAQQETIRAKFVRTDKGYELCNFDEMLCPATPEGFVVDAVYLYGLDYNFNVRGPGELTAGVYLGDEGKYERQYDSFMEIISNHQLDSHTTETHDGVAYENYVITTSVAQIKYVFMTISTEGKVTPTRVIMRFLLRSQTQPDEVSDTVPRAVYVFGEDCGMPYDYLIHGVSEAPTVEWLSSFGLVPYEDDSSAAVS